MWINREDKVNAEMSDVCYYCATDKEACNRLKPYRDSNKRIRINIFNCEDIEPLDFNSMKK